MTLKNNRAPLLSNTKFCASFHHHIWIQTGVTVIPKRLNGVNTSVTLTFDLWPWPFVWTSRLSIVITPENFRMIRWQEHCQESVTDGQTDRQTEISVLIAAWSQLKILTQDTASLLPTPYNRIRTPPYFKFGYGWLIITHGIMKTWLFCWLCHQVLSKMGQYLFW